VQDRSEHAKGWGRDVGWLGSLPTATARRRTTLGSVAICKDLLAMFFFGDVGREREGPTGHGE
jgi:hypothetical protein